MIFNFIMIYYVKTDTLVRIVVSNTISTFKAIPDGVLNLLVKLNSRTEDNIKMDINEIYPNHTIALHKTVLNMNIFPTLK